MRRVRDVSPAVRELAYCDEARTLDVVWATSVGAVYRFYDVPPEVFDWLLNQRSKGGFIRRKIIGTYRETRIDERGGGHDLDLLEALEKSVSAIGTAPPPIAGEDEDDDGEGN